MPFAMQNEHFSYGFLPSSAFLQSALLRNPAFADSVSQRRPADRAGSQCAACETLESCDKCIAAHGATGLRCAPECHHLDIILGMLEFASPFRGAPSRSPEVHVEQHCAVGFAGVGRST